MFGHNKVWNKSTRAGRMGTFARLVRLSRSALEGLKTRSSGNRLSPTGSRFSVLSPTFQLLWKVPEAKGDQLRIAVGRTYKAPTAKELIPRV